MITAKAKEPGKTKTEAPEVKKQSSTSPTNTVFNPVWSQMALGVQAKLTIGQPDDQYEREADQVADQVMRMPEPGGSDDDEKIIQTNSITNQITPLVQRAKPEQMEEDEMALQAMPAEGSEHDEEEETVQVKPLIQRQVDEQQEETVQPKHGHGNSSAQVSKAITPSVHSINSHVQRLCTDCEKEKQQQTSIQTKPASGQNPQVSPSVAASIQSMNGGGSPLPRSARSFFEPRFGADFSGVRVHTDSRAAETAKSINARAFTIGQNIAFGAGQYAPETHAGRRLLGHELTHVVQQDSSTNSRELQRKPTGNELLISPFFSRYPYFQQMNADDSIILQKYKGKWKGDHVRLLQYALLELNYSLPEFEADGKFGDETETALKNFQIDSGLTGDDVDGILGQKTLRLLDARFSTKSMTKVIGTSKGTFYTRNVPVTPDMVQPDISQEQVRQKFTKAALMKIFKIPGREAEVLIGQGWYIENYTAVTQAHVDAGFRKVKISRSLFESIKGKSEENRGGKPAGSAKQQLEEKMLNVQDTKNLHIINQAIAEKESEIVFAQLNRRTPLAAIIKLQQELNQIIKQRNQELERLGLTLDDYKQKVSGFKNAFANFAVQKALKMLEENLTSANIEKQRYGDLENVSQVKKILGSLNESYKKADENWWKGLSYEETGDPDAIKNSGDFEKYVPSGKYWDPKISKMQAYRKYRFKEKGKNQYFDTTYDLEHQAHQELAKAAKNYPILAFPGLEIRVKASVYSKMTPAELQKVLTGKIGGAGQDSGIIENIKKTREQINTTNIWELAPVIVHAKREMGILKGSVHDLIIQEAIQEAKDDKFWRDLALGALGIGLGLLALASGPVGWAALAGGIAVGGIDAYIQYQEITFHEEASGTALDPEKALSSVDPSWFWFVISLVGLGLDIGAAAKLVKTVAKGVKSIKTGDELIEATVDAIEAEKKAVKESLETATGESHEQLSKTVKQLEEAENSVKSKIFQQKAGILAKVADDPELFGRLGDIMTNDEIAEALVKLQSKLPEEQFLDVLKFYGGVGKKWAHQLPDVVDVAQKGKLDTVSELYQQVLTDPRVQKVLLDNADEPNTLLEAWQKWQKAKTRTKPPPVKIPFPDYLGRIGHKTKLGIKSESLIEKFGKAFLTEPNSAKNRQVLRTTEGDLVDAINAGDILPKKVQEAIETLLDEDLIRSAQTVEDARARIIKQIIRVIGEQTESFSSFEHWVRTLVYLRKFNAAGELVIQAEKVRLTFGDLLHWDELWKVLGNDTGGHLLQHHGPFHTRTTLLQRILNEKSLGGVPAPRLLPGGVKETDFRIWKGKKELKSCAWKSNEDMLGSIEQIINENINSINDVISRGGSISLERIPLGRPIGKGWITSIRGVGGTGEKAIFWTEDLRHATVVIRPLPKSKFGWYVHTAYPEI